MCDYEKGLKYVNAVNRLEGCLLGLKSVYETGILDFEEAIDLETAIDYTEDVLGALKCQAENKTLVDDEDKGFYDGGVRFSEKYQVGYEQGNSDGYEEAIEEMESEHLLLDRSHLESLGAIISTIRGLVVLTADLDNETGKEIRKNLFNLHHQVYSFTSELVMDNVRGFWNTLIEEDEEDDEDDEDDDRIVGLVNDRLVGVVNGTVEVERKDSDSDDFYAGYLAGATAAYKECATAAYKECATAAYKEGYEIGYKAIKLNAEHFEGI